MITKRISPAIAVYLISATMLSACIPDKSSLGETGLVYDFALSKPFLNDSTDAYSRRAGTTFPDDPVGYFTALKSARRMIHNGECPGAVPLLERATREYQDNGNTWGMLGTCYFKTADWLGAAHAYQQALELGATPWDREIDLNPNDMMIAIAQAHARAGDNDLSIAWLQRGLDMRYDERPDIAGMPEFSTILDDPRFASLAGLPPSEDLNRDEQWRYDIAFLGAQVSALHVNPDHHTSAESLNLMLSEVSASVPDLSDEEITARLDIFIGALGAGHDLFWPVAPKRGALLPFALKIYLFTDGLYIIDAYDPELIGTRIEAFGDTPTEEAYARVALAFPGDNEMQARWMGVRHLTQAYTLEALGIVDDQATMTLTITSPTGDRRKITPERRAFTSMSPSLKATPATDVPLYLSRPTEDRWLQRLENLQALYVHIHSVADGTDESLAQFAARVGAEAERPEVKNLILDLRQSPGGNGYLTPPLLRQLIRFDAAPDRGQLYVIIGRNTFSASQNMITDLDRLAEPVFVGEPSGSRPNALSESGNFKLPYSGLSGVLSSQLHQQSVPEDHRLWIPPDVPVGLTSAEFFAGRDPALEAIARLIAAESSQSRLL
jgi:hypothetical protein